MNKLISKLGGRKIAPSPNSNANLKPNPHPAEGEGQFSTGAIFWTPVNY